MKKMMALFVLLMSTQIFAADPGDEERICDFAMVMDAGRIRMLAQDGAVAYISSGIRPAFSWENNYSEVTITKTSGGFSINWSLNVSGPGYIKISIEEDACGISFNLVDTVDGRRAPVHVIYDNYDVFINDKEFGQFNQILMRRLFGHYHFPDFSITKKIMLRKQITVSDEKAKELDSLLELGNSDDFRVREEATLELIKPENAVYLISHIRGKELSPEQYVRVGLVVARYEVILPAEIKTQVLNEPD